MEALVTALTTAITPTALWGAITPFAPLVAVLVIFAFSYGVVHKVIKGAGKGKAKI